MFKLPEGIWSTLTNESIHNAMGQNRPIGSMYGIYANIGDILMGSMLAYIAYMDPMGYVINTQKKTLIIETA